MTLTSLVAVVGLRIAARAIAIADRSRFAAVLPRSALRALAEPSDRATLDPDRARERLGRSQSTAAADVPEQAA